MCDWREGGGTERIPYLDEEESARREPLQVPEQHVQEGLRGRGRAGGRSLHEHRHQHRDDERPDPSVQSHVNLLINE
jgi:hypothetical protein